MRFLKHSTLLVSAMAAIFFALLFAAERSRQRRAGTPRAVCPSAPKNAPPDERAPVSAPNDLADRRMRAPHRSHRGALRGRMPRTPVLAGGAIVALGVLLLSSRSAAPAQPASLTVETLSTHDGAMVVAHARNFAPRASLDLSWRGGADRPVHATTSPDGEVLAAISYPSGSSGGMSDGMLELVASDGAHMATADVMPGAAAPAAHEVALSSASRRLKATPTPGGGAGTAVAAPSPTATSASGSPLVFGRTSAAGYNDGSDSGYLNGTRVVLSQAGSLESLSVYVGATSGTGRVALALYTDTSGAPGARIAVTSASIAQPGWNSLATLTSPQIAAAAYWVVAQTDDPGTVYRMTTDLTAGAAAGWAPHSFGHFPASVSGWVSVSGESFSMYGTVVASPTVGAGGTISTPTPAPVYIPPGDQITPIATSTPATPSPTATAPAPSATPRPATATPTSSSGFTCPLNPAGGSQCGTPMNFCDTWSGGYCNDFRDVQTATHIPFPRPSDGISLDLMDTTDPGYGWTDCCSDGTFMPQAFLANEHFMIAWTSAVFGDAIMRLHQPFDFAGRTGHVHFDVDLKTRSRGYLRLTLSPEVTKRGNDDRSGTTGGSSLAYPPDGLDIWFQGSPDFGGNIGVTENRNGGCGSGYCFKSTATSPTNVSLYAGHDNVRDSVDVYVSRTHLRFVINGAQVWETNIPDIGFDRAYVYLQQAQYNPCKEGPWPHELWPDSPLDQCSMAAQMFHWDNVAFDGPVLATNSLTPPGSEDVVFNAYSATSCNVNGAAAQPVGTIQQYAWISWTARLPAGTSVALSGVQCQYNFVSNGSDTPRGLEIVQAGG